MGQRKVAPFRLLNSKYATVDDLLVSESEAVYSLSTD